jgi:hypothetical protein
VDKELSTTFHTIFVTSPLLGDIPSAYLNTPLSKGKKHLIRIKPSIAKYFVIADPSAKNFLQKDGSLLVQLEKALYGLPEAGKL